MWQTIFLAPEVQRDEHLRKVMLRRFDYERLYHEVSEGKCAQAEDDEYRKLVEAAHGAQESFAKAVEGAYIVLDNHIRQFCLSPDPVWRDGALLQGLKRLMGRIWSDAEGGYGYFFTLDQDLFIERFYKNYSRDVFPGIDLSGQPNWFRHGSAWGDELRREDHISLTSETRGVRPAKFNYIKLHGSYGWFRNGRQRMVVGLNKLALIENDPILRLHYEWFQQVLKETKNLLIIGYGFGDEHINAPIANAVKNGLKVFIVTPVDPKTQQARLDDSKKCPGGQGIWEGVSGYLPCTLRDLFPVGSGGTSPLWEMLEEALFR